MMLRTLSRFFSFRGRRGAVAIEYALLLPALLLFVIGIMEVGRLLWTQTTLERAVEAAARCGAVNQTDCSTSAAVAGYAVTQAFGLPVDAGAFTVTKPACGVFVSVDFTYKFVVPWVTPQDMTLHAQACYPAIS